MSAQACSEEISVVVKHTFIDVSLPSTAQDSLRRSSVPAGMWLCPTGIDQGEICGVSDVSTVSATGYDDDRESEGESEDINSRRVSTEVTPQQLDAQQHETPQLDTCSGRETRTALRTALRPTAKAWQPMQGAAQAWQSQRFDKQVADIKAKVEVAMLCSGYDAEISIEKESNGYTVSVTMATENAERFGDNLLAEAQQTLLTASQQSSCVCVLGYGRRPFQPLNKGFIATLAEMQDEAMACWDMYAWGSCPYGCACNRQHPRSVAYIVVQLVA